MSADFYILVSINLTMEILIHNEGMVNIHFAEPHPLACYCAAEEMCSGLSLRYHVGLLLMHFQNCGFAT